MCARLAKFNALLKSKGISDHDVEQIIATFDRVDTGKGFYIDASYTELVRDGIGEKIARTCETLYGRVLVNSDVFRYICEQRYTVETVYQLLSEKSMADAVESGATFDGLHDVQKPGGDLVARPLIDSDGETVYARLTSTGKLYKQRYTFARAFNVFVAPALKETTYDHMETGDIDIVLRPVKSVNARIANK